MLQSYQIGERNRSITIKKFLIILCVLHVKVSNQTRAIYAEIIALFGPCLLLLFYNKACIQVTVSKYHHRKAVENKGIAMPIYIKKYWFNSNGCKGIL